MGSNVHYGIAHSLKTYRPHYIKAFGDDDTELYRVNNPEIRNRVQKVMNALEGIPWGRVEMFDKKDGLLFTYKRNPSVDDPPAGELENLTPGFASTDRGIAALAGVAQVMSAAMHNSMKLVITEMRETTKPLTDSLLRIIDVTMNRLTLHEKQYEHALAANHRLNMENAKVSAALVRASQPAESIDEDDDLDRLAAIVLPGFARAAMAKKGDDDQEHDDDKPKRDPSREGKSRIAARQRAREHNERVKNANGVNGTPSSSS